MKIIVQNIMGRRTTLDVEPDDTFTDLKAHYQDKTVPAVAFVFCTMADHHTLADYNIPQASSRSMGHAATSPTAVVILRQAAGARV